MCDTIPHNGKWRKETIMEDPLAVKEQVKRHLSSTLTPSGPSPQNSPDGYINTLPSYFLFVSLRRNFH